MCRQADLSSRMRAILIDWLVSTHRQLRLGSPTLWTAVSIVDRYLERKKLYRRNLQLLGTVALFIASKLHDRYSPELVDMAAMNVDQNEEEELEDMCASIVSMEHRVLSKLKYDVLSITPLHFLSLFFEEDDNDELRCLCKYFGERCLQEYDSLIFYPSFLASGILLTARMTLYQWSPTSNAAYREFWPQALANRTGLSQEALLPVAVFLLRTLPKNTTTASGRVLESVRLKYTQGRFCRVSAIPIPTLQAFQIWFGKEKRKVAEAVVMGSLAVDESALSGGRLWVTKGQMEEIGAECRKEEERKEEERKEEEGAREEKEEQKRRERREERREEEEQVDSVLSSILERNRRSEEEEEEQEEQEGRRRSRRLSSSSSSRPDC